MFLDILNLKCLWDTGVCESDTQKGGLEFGVRNMRLISVLMAFMELDEITKGASVGREEELWKEVDGERGKKYQERVVSWEEKKMFQ